MEKSYQTPKEELLQQLGTSENGLSSAKAEENLEKYGRNEITGKKAKNPFFIFLEQFKDFLVIILIIAALISAFTGDLESFIVIIAVITMNASLGTVQTVKAEKSLSNLKKLSSPTAKVLRDGQTAILPAEEITVGDVVLLEAGDQIPADGRLIDCASLQTNESALTGESTNVEKSLDTITDEVPLADRKNMVYSGGFVIRGYRSGHADRSGKDRFPDPERRGSENPAANHTGPVRQAAFYRYHDRLCTGVRAEHDSR